MSETASKLGGPRWARTFRSADGLPDDLGNIGAWVGPRTGPFGRRTQGQKEDYVLRRLLVAWKRCGTLKFPVDVHSGNDQLQEPDFVLSWSDRKLGLEATEAGNEDYQAWLTHTAQDHLSHVPFDPSTPGTANEIRDAIARKVGKFDGGNYRGAPECDLMVYDNTSWGGFLDKGEILAALGRPNDLLGRFRQVHIVFGETVYLDIFGSAPSRVDVSDAYEIDYARWLAEQVVKIRHGATEEVDLAHIAEELDDLAKSERRALASHLGILLLHLLKWQSQAERRSESWRLSIDNARRDIHELLTESPSLRRSLAERLEDEYMRARRNAAGETGISSDRFPVECPFTREQVVDPEFFPEAED